MKAARRILHACRSLTALVMMAILATPPAWGAERRNRFTREDLAFLAGLGFDHLRIPIDEELVGILVPK